MSRCFPFPPPGYGVRGEAVRDPIKLQKGTDKPISDLDSKKRRDRKERKEKKDRKRDDKGKKEHGYKVEDTHKIPEKSLLPKGKEDEAERSDLTAEHEQPVSALNVCHSPDSSGRGNKRKLDNSASISKAHGNVLRIRLPLQRHREPDSSIEVERLSSGSGNPMSLAELAVPSTSQEECPPVISNSVFASKLVKDSCDADLKVKDTKPDSLPVPRRKEHKKEKLYKSLIVDWVPPPLEMDQIDFDDSWLHQTKGQDQLGCKRFKPSHDDKPCHESSNLWPCARYLAEADVYALPYSVPF